MSRTCASRRAGWGPGRCTANIARGEHQHAGPAARRSHDLAAVNVREREAPQALAGRLRVICGCARGVLLRRVLFEEGRPSGGCALCCHDDERDKRCQHGGAGSPPTGSSTPVPLARLSGGRIRGCLGALLAFHVAPAFSVIAATGVRSGRAAPALMAVMLTRASSSRCRARARGVPRGWTCRTVGEHESARGLPGRTRTASGRRRWS